MKAYSTGTLTIANGASVSDALPLDGQSGFQIYLPALDAGACRLQGSPDGSTWYDCFDTAAATLQFASNSGAFCLDCDYCARFMFNRFVRVKTSNNQTAARTLTYIMWRAV